MTSNLPTTSYDSPPDRSAARLIAIEFDGSTCHQVFGRHYHCANCGDGPTSQQGHLRGDPPQFACSEQPWPEAEGWPIVSFDLSSHCFNGGHIACNGFYPTAEQRVQGARCGCPCHAGQHQARRPVRARTIVLTEVGRLDLAAMARGGAS